MSIEIIGKKRGRHTLEKDGKRRAGGGGGLSRKRLKYTMEV